MSAKPFSLYVHIPFCFHKCPYCDFNAYAVSSIPEKEYVSALLAELDYRSTLPEWHGRTIQSIYFGGGTPSLFQPNSIRKIIRSVCSLFPVDERVEVSLESNPGTLTPDNLQGYRDAGVNRLSIGAQSFQRRVLAALGRMHSPDHIEAAVSSARAAGISNISLDLIYGGPEQTIEEFEADLDALLALEPVHVSAYGLTIEKGTPFFLSYKRGQLHLPSEEHVIQMMESINSRFSLFGLYRYEISNYAIVGREARHNLAYWNGDDYLGIGAGAHSFSARLCKDNNYGTRWSNVALPAKYIENAIAQGQAEGWRDELDFTSSVFEYFFLGLRKIAGVSKSGFEKRFGCSIESVYPALLQVLADERLLTVNENAIALSEKGLLLADSVIENFAHPERPPQGKPLLEVADKNTLQTVTIERSPVL
jgi:oxygen-independent coproporphyrinogen-3 oxidase